MPASRIILAVPYYGRAWSTDSAAVNARNISGTKNGASTTVVYGMAYEYARDHGRKYDPVEGVAWTVYKRQNCTGTYGCVSPWRQIYYDDVQALGTKYDLVERYRLRGVGIWALGYDGTRPELYQLLKNKFVHDTVPPVMSRTSVSSAAISPNGDGRLDTVTMKSAVTGHVRFGYAVEPYFDNIAGTAVRSGNVDSKNVIYTWNGTRFGGSVVPDGPYRITLWTVDASNNRASVQRVVTVDRKAPAIRSSVTPTSISPDGDGRADSTALRMSADSRVSGTARVLGPTGAAVRVFPMTPGTSGFWAWNGKNAAGAVVPDGRYTFRVEGLDPAGNRDGPRCAGPGRPEHQVAGVDGVVVPAVNRRVVAGRADPRPQGDGLRGRLSRFDARADRVDEQAACRGDLPLDVERPNGQRRTRAIRHVPSGRDRDQLDRPIDGEPHGHGGAVTVVAAPTLAVMTEPQASAAPAPEGAGVWIVLPTYNEAENVGPVAAAILAALPAATLLVVDDGSPDGTGELADQLASGDQRIRVRHRRAKQGLGRAYLDGFQVALGGGALTVVQMDADFSHDPATLPALVGPVVRGEADLVIGSRYTPGGGVVDWGLARRFVSRGGSLFARTVLHLPPHDLTGGFKAWRASTLSAVPFDGVHAGGYVFQIEMTFRASRAGARIREIPITFRDRRVGQSKMSRRIIFEALVVVCQLRAEELRRRLSRSH